MRPSAAEDQIRVIREELSISENIFYIIQRNEVQTRKNYTILSKDPGL